MMVMVMKIAFLLVSVSLVEAQVPVDSTIRGNTMCNSYVKCENACLYFQFLQCGDWCESQSFHTT